VSTSGVSYLIWALLAAGALGLHALSRLRPDVAARPARVVERLATGPVLRVALVLGVMWTGWHFFAR
jgi:hypothetical protein